MKKLIDDDGEIIVLSVARRLTSSAFQSRRKVKKVNEKLKKDAQKFVDNMAAKFDDNLNVTGNGCNRGITYAKDELTNPTRMVTSTVKVIGGKLSRVPVVTSKPVPKNKIMDVMEEINKVQVNAPIYIKDIIISNVLGLGVDIVATRSVL